MSDSKRDKKDPDEEFDHGSEAKRADEAAKPSDVGALDGAAAAGSAGAASEATDDEGGVPSHRPDPSVGPD
jgi:hypothetical protein